MLTITSLLDYFQDCSTFQSEDLGVGIEPLRRMNAMWVINSWQIDIMRLPRMLEHVTIGTIPYECKGFFGKRNFYMKDEKGDFIAKADTVWTYLNTVTGKPDRIPQEIIDRYGEMEKLDMEYVGRKIRIPKDTQGEVKDPIPVTEHLLDVNHHVNNGKYLELAASFMNEDIRPDRIRVEYRNQAFLNDVIYPTVYRGDGPVIVTLSDAEAKPYAVAEFSGGNL